MSHLCFAPREKGEVCNHTHLAARKCGVLQDSKLGVSAEMMVDEGAPTLAPICSVHLQAILHRCFWQTFARRAMGWLALLWPPS